jgi:hypothetical protein
MSSASAKLACRGLIVSMVAKAVAEVVAEALAEAMAKTVAETMAEMVAEAVAETGVAETPLCIVSIYLVIYRVYRGGLLVPVARADTVGDGDVTAVDTKCVLAIVVGS